MSRSFAKLKYSFFLPPHIIFNTKVLQVNAQFLGQHNNFAIENTASLYFDGPFNTFCWI